MSSKLFSAMAACVLALVLAAAAPAQPAATPSPSPASQPVAADTPQSTPFGITFTLPKDWSSRTGPGWVDALPPEGDSDIVIVDAGAAKDGPEAASKAWAMFRPPGMQRKVLLTPALPPREFWDEGTQVAYEVSPAEHRAVTAIASRKGGRWTVILLDANASTVEKRGAAISLMLGTLKPAGEVRESFAGKMPHRLDAERVAMLKAFVESGMKELNVPGVAVALIDHDQ